MLTPTFLAWETVFLNRFAKLFLTFGFTLLIVQAAFSQSCQNIILSTAYETQPEVLNASGLTLIERSPRTLGYEIEVYGDHIREITSYLASAYDSTNYGRVFKFSLASELPLVFWKLEALSEHGDVIRIYDIHGFPDSNGVYTYHLFQDENYQQRVLHSKLIEDLKSLAFELMSEDAPQNIATIQSEEAFHWRTQIKHAQGIIEERDIILQVHEGNFELILFIDLESEERMESGLSFSTREAAFSYIQELFNKGEFQGRSFVETEMGVIQIVPESSGTEITQSPFIDLNDFSTELIFPPVLRDSLEILFEPLRQLSLDETLIPSDPLIHLATHLNIGFNTENLIDVVDMILKLHVHYDYFRNKYQTNNGRTIFAKPLTEAQLLFLQELKQRGRATRSDILDFINIATVETDEGPKIDKFFWLNLAHFSNVDGSDFRPALEIRIADSLLSPERIIELADDVLRIIE